jgi:hypothetical protein
VSLHTRTGVATVRTTWFPPCFSTGPRILRQPAGLVSLASRSRFAFLAERASGSEGESHLGHNLTQPGVVGHPRAQNLLGRQLPDDVQGVTEPFHLGLGLLQALAAKRILSEGQMAFDEPRPQTVETLAASKRAAALALRAALEEIIGRDREVGAISPTLAAPLQPA